MLSAVAAETVEKAAEVPRAGGGGGGGGRWRGGRASSEWSSPAGLSRAHRRELRMGGEEETGEGEGLQRSTILVRSFAQSFCMPARFHARGTRVLARRGMRFDDGGVATTLREDMILERVLLYRRRKRALRLIFFFF